MTADKKGRIVWHDLFTGDRQGAMAFYAEVAGWTYLTEHATDFAWGGGEKDFVLALSGDEAGAGFAETPAGLGPGWIAYVEVDDVDATATLAQELGGAIVRAPFDVPGVGRNGLVRDPLGALIGVSLSRHDYPAPRRQFGSEAYLCNIAAFPVAFYRQLLGWEMSSRSKDDRLGGTVVGPSGEDVAVCLDWAAQANAPPAVWVPRLKVPDPEAALRVALAHGGEDLRSMTTAPDGPRLLRDPDGSLFSLA